MLWEGQLNMIAKKGISKGYESIGRLLVPKQFFASDGSVVRMTRSGWISRNATRSLAMAIFVRLIGLAALLLILSSIWEFSDARAEIPSDQAVRAIIGEAANQGEGMLAVAEAIRNRGTLQGVYGLRRDISKEPAWVWPKAEKAWRDSALASSKSSLVKGASIWGTAEDVSKFQKHTWFRRYVLTAHIGAHYFFKLRPSEGHSSQRRKPTTERPSNSHLDGAEPFFSKRGAK